MVRLVLVALVIVASMAAATPAGGFAQQTGIAAVIHQGDCGDIGEIVAPLVEARVPAGEPRGNLAALPAATSFTTVPISLEALASSDHSIAIPFPVGEELVACGEIGGVFTETSALVVGISPRGELGISGIAYLGPGADPAQTNVSLFISGEALDTYLTSTFSPPTAVPKEDAARFAAALAARDGSPRLAGPFAGQLVQRQGQRVIRGAGVATADFSATVTFTNPTAQTATPWDVGLAFHQNAEQTAGQELVVTSDGSWFYQDPVTGRLQVAPLTGFDAAPGATNTLDLIVAGETALFGVNGELVASIDLPPPTPSDVFVTTDFSAENIVEDRAITFTGFAVWGTETPAPQASAPSTDPAEDDAARFAAALAARQDTRSLAGPFGGTFTQSFRGLAVAPAGIAAERFSATVTFTNPTEQTGAPWDYGFAFHQNPEQSTIQEIYLDSNGFWYYTNFPNGVQQSGIVPSFDASPGGKNTLDIVVDGTTALFGANGEFLARIDLPAAMPGDVFAGTDFFVDNVVEGREIAYSAFEVWE